MTFSEFQDRARPAVGDDQRQGVRVTRADVYELNVEPVDLGHKHRQGIQLRLHLPPVVVRPPVAYERLDLRQLHALGLISDGLPGGPPGRRHAPAEVDECLFRNVDAEGVDCVVFGRARPGQVLGLRTGLGGLLRERGSGRCQRHRCRKEHGEESREQAEGSRGR